MAIFLDREGVETCVSAISKQIEALQSAAASIDSTVTSDMGNYWSGNAYDKTMTTYAEEYQTMLTTTIPDMVQQLNDFIDGCKEAIVQVDEQLAGSGS